MDLQSLQNLKTNKSKRKVSLPDSVCQQLKEYNLHCRKEKLRLCDSWKGGNVFLYSLMLKVSHFIQNHHIFGFELS